jgi:transposase
MARRTFDVIDVAEILVHWHAGRSLSEMSLSLGVDRKTLRKYVAPAVAAGIVPGGAAKSEQEWHELVREWFPELADTRLRQVTWPVIAGHHDYIVEQLKARVRMSTIHQRLRDERGLAASVASFRRYVNANIPEEIRRSQVTVWNPHPAEAGGQAQIDYGQLGRWLDPVSGKLRTVWAFVMVLACSRHMFVRPVLRMDQRAWTECHVAAFEFFDGVPARLVPDNLKTGVDKPDLYDPKLNRSYAEMAAHYGCLIDPARALKPRDKPQVERPMPYVRDSFWRGREFASLPQMQAGAVRWSLEVAGRRHCRPLDGAAPAAVFEAAEKDALRPLPGEPFVLATWATAKIGPDIHLLTELAEIFQQVACPIAGWSAMVADRDRGRGCDAGPGRAGGARCGVAAGDRQPVGAIPARRPGRRCGGRGLRLVRGPAGCGPAGGHTALIRNGPAAMVQVPLGSRNRVEPGDPRRGT